MGYYFVEKSNEIVAVSPSLWDLASFYRPDEIQWTEEFPGEKEPEIKVDRAPRQIVRPKTFKPRADLLTACHWRG